MLTFLSLSLLVVAMFAPPLLLYQYEDKMSWRSRYSLSILPVAYTWGGWRTGVAAYDFLGCQGGTKSVHACFANGIDLTALVDHGFFLMIPCVFVATPLSLWLLLNTGAKQIGAWHLRNK